MAGQQGAISSGLKAMVRTQGRGALLALLLSACTASEMTSPQLSTIDGGQSLDLKEFSNEHLKKLELLNSKISNEALPCCVRSSHPKDT